jgi:predicted nucleic acid-binding protein
MTTNSARLVDTCVLVEATDEARLHHRSARDLLERRTSLVLSAQVIREYLVVATRPVSQNGLGLHLALARANIAAFRQNVRLLPEERPILPAFNVLLDTCPVLGKRLHDAFLAATAVTHHVRVVITLNAPDFAAFHPHLVPITLEAALRT